MDKKIILLLILLCSYHTTRTFVMTPNEVYLSAGLVGTGVFFIGYECLAKDSDDSQYEHEKKSSKKDYAFLALGTIFSSVLTHALLSCWTPKEYIKSAKNLLRELKSSRYRKLTETNKGEDACKKTVESLFTGKYHLLEANSTCDLLLDKVVEAQKYALTVQEANKNSWEGQKIQEIINEAEVMNRNLTAMNSYIRNDPLFFKQQTLQTHERQTARELEIQQKRLETKQRKMHAKEIQADAECVQAIAAVIEADAAVHNAYHKPPLMPPHQYVHPTPPSVWSASPRYPQYPNANIVCNRSRKPYEGYTN
jgi:hypothetical protein